jgi:hypothetical protein
LLYDPCFPAGLIGSLPVCNKYFHLTKYAHNLLGSVTLPRHPNAPSRNFSLFAFGPTLGRPSRIKDEKKNDVKRGS